MIETDPNQTAKKILDNILLTGEYPDRFWYISIDIIVMYLGLDLPKEYCPVEFLKDLKEKDPDNYHKFEKRLYLYSQECLDKYCQDNNYSKIDSIFTI